MIGISDQFKIPVRYIGVGEGIEDLQVLINTNLSIRYSTNAY